MSSKREIIITLHKDGLTRGEIFKQVKKFGISRSMVYRTVKLLNETGDIKNRKRKSWKRTARTTHNIKIARERIRRNLEISSNKLAKDLHISQKSAYRILVEDLGLHAYKKRKQHGTTEAQTEKRFKRSKLLLARHADSDVIFSDEKLFLLQQPHNSQNDRVYAASIRNIPTNKRSIPRFQNPQSVMVWGAVSKKGKLPLLFIDKGVKINKNYYLEEVLKTHMLPHAKALYGNNPFTFQQDSAPAHASDIVQQWCKRNFPGFITKEEWPPSSPDLNPLDYSIWGLMLKRLTNKKLTTLENFKKLLEKIWDEIPESHVRAACEGWKNRLKLVRKAKGVRIE